MRFYCPFITIFEASTFKLLVVRKSQRILFVIPLFGPVIFEETGFVIENLQIMPNQSLRIELPFEFFTKPIKFRVKIPVFGLKCYKPITVRYFSFSCRLKCQDSNLLLLQCK